MQIRFVVGVDTHPRNHVYAILAANIDALLNTREFPQDLGRHQPVIDWVTHRTP